MKNIHVLLIISTNTIKDPHLKTITKKLATKLAQFQTQIFIKTKLDGVISWDFLSKETSWTQWDFPKPHTLSFWWQSLLPFSRSSSSKIVMVLKLVYKIVMEHCSLWRWQSLSTLFKTLSWFSLMKDPCSWEKWTTTCIQSLPTSLVKSLLSCLVPSSLQLSMEPSCTTLSDLTPTLKDSLPIVRHSFYILTHWFLVFIMVLIYSSAGSYALIISTIFSDKQLAVTLTPVLIIPFMLFAGFFVTQDNIPIWLIEFQYISFFKYGYQALMWVSIFPFLNKSSSIRTSMMDYILTVWTRLSQLNSNATLLATSTLLKPSGSQFGP